MDYLLQRRQSPSFALSEEMLPAVHFMICRSDPANDPGQCRPGWIGT